jgi:hypothetical protein
MKIGISSTALLALTVMLLLIAGCGKGDTMKAVYSTNIKKLHQCYIMYMEENGFRGPKDEAEFKNYLKTDATAIHLLKRIDITPETVDDIFIGDRDGEPFVVRYGLTGVADHAVVLEAVGVEGMRIVALANPLEVDEATYDDYLSGKIKPEREAGTGAGEVEE